MHYSTDGKRAGRMKDLIEREDAIDAIEGTDWYHQNRNKDMVSGANSDEHQAWYKAEDVYKALKEVPSADRPQGEWIYTDDDVFAGEYTCSNCNKRAEVDLYGQWILSNYCPNCGCRMKGASNGEDIQSADE